MMLFAPSSITFVDAVIMFLSTTSLDTMPAENGIMPSFIRIVLAISEHTYFSMTACRSFFFCFRDLTSLFALSSSVLARFKSCRADSIEVYLPKPLTDEELTSGLKDIIGEVGASGPKDMGKVMGVASRRFAGRADGKVISQRVRELLS